MTAPYLSKIRFLVVEDNDFSQAIVRDVLKALGARHILYAKDGAEALELARTNAVDIVLLDWAMPEMDGLDFTRTIRLDEDSPNPFLPIIMMTAYSERAHVLKARDAGVTEYVIKPFSANQLFKRIQVVIENPRPFVKAENYFGPDRRRHRKKKDGYSGPERREKERAKTPREQAEEQKKRDEFNREDLDQAGANQYFTPDGAEKPDDAGTK